MKKIYISLLFILTLVSLSALLKPQPAAASDCGGPVPPKLTKVWAKSGPMGGQVTLYWEQAPHANRYAVAYGTMSNKYMYGADNIGGEGTRSYTVKSLKPGQKYYFRLAAANGCASSGFSDEVMAVSGGGVVMEVQKPAVTQKVEAKVMAPSSAGPVGVQKLWAKTGPKIGEVTLYWMNTENADNYHLVYGTEHGKFKYGALNIGKVNKFTVKKLVAGVEYHFALVPVMAGQAMYTTSQVIMRAFGGGEVVVTSKENLIQPRPKAETQTTPKVVSPSPVVKTTTPESSPSGY